VDNSTFVVALWPESTKLLEYWTSRWKLLSLLLEIST